MPPLIVWTFGAIGAAVVAKWLLRQARRLNPGWQGEGAATDGTEQGPRPTLRRDPITGVYSPQ